MRSIATVHKDSRLAVPHQGPRVWIRASYAAVVGASLLNRTTNCRRGKLPQWCRGVQASECDSCLGAASSVQ